MMVVADTGPVNYLILSGHIGLIPPLYGSLILPPAVHRELLHPKAPPDVRDWASTLPAWAEVRPPQDASRFAELGPGEREAISLALEAKVDFLLIDETKGRETAVSHGVRVKGTLGILEEAAERRLVNLPEAVVKLRSTGIFLADDVVQRVLDRHNERVIGYQRATQRVRGHDQEIER
jgi:predicted nucleic acid-binding protein